MFVNTSSFDVSYVSEMHLSFSEVFLVKIYHVLVLSIALVGNSLVILGSIKYHAIDMDKVSLILMESLAITDIIISFVFGIPICMVLFKEKWVLGKLVCYIQGLFGYVPIFAEVLTIVTISAHRLWILTRPLHLHELRSRHMYLITAVLWILPLVYVLTKIGIGQHVYFDPRLLTCNSNGLTDSDFKELTIFAVLIFSACPLVIIIFFNITIFIVATRSATRSQRNCCHSAHRHGNRRYPKPAVITVLAISCIFILSILPFMTRGFAQVLNLTEIPLKFYIFQMEVLFVNVAFNPIVYTCTSRRFRVFLGHILKNNLNQLTSHFVCTVSHRPAQEDGFVQ